MSAIEMLGLLIAGHALADYPLQGDFLAKGKSRFSPMPGVPWYQALGAHAAIHGAMVGLITGSIFLAALETAAHACIDDAKCAGRISFNQDQILHVVCKVAWLGILLGAS